MKSHGALGNVKDEAYDVNLYFSNLLRRTGLHEIDKFGFLVE